MNLSNVFILLSSAVVFAQQTEREEIISIQYSTVKSEYAYSSDGIYRLYTPTRSGVISSLPQGSSTGGDFGNYTSSSMRSALSPIQLQQSSIEMSGAYILLLEPYLIPRSVERIGSNVLFCQISEKSPFRKLESFDDYRQIEQLAQTSTGTEYGPYHLFRSNTVLPFRYSTGNLDENSFFNSYSSRYRTGFYLLELWNNFLREEKFTFYGKPFFVKTDNGDIYPAVIKIFGTEQLMYAMYGVWTDEEKAEKYSFHKGDRIYFSAKSMVPVDGYKTCSAASDLSIPRAQRFGKKIFKYDEIIADRCGIYPQLAWSIEPIHSDMANKDSDGIGTAYHNGIEIPNSPDSDNNTNGLGLQQCPDMDWYWSLFCDCANKIISSPEKEYQSTEFVDYRDYAYMEMMKKQYDPTIYGEDNSVSPLKATTERQPSDPLLFNKECVLLNAPIPEVYDPFAADATFGLHYRYWDWSLNNLGWHAHLTDITSKMKNSLTELRYVYNYFCSPGEHETEWGYEKVNGKWHKIWPHGGDVEITLDKPDYADSAWVLANPFANYGPYEDFTSFAIYDKYTAANEGPFYLFFRESVYRDDNAKNIPEYKRSKFTFTVNHEPFNPRNTKDWYLRWEYDLIHNDKWGRKVFVGTLAYTLLLWKDEDSNVLPPGYTLNDKPYNKTVTIGGTTLLNSQAAYYNKNSKEYRTDQTDVHDRDPEEFDKGDAMREIAMKILVAEAFDYAMKTLHYVGTHQDNYVGYAAAGLYETSKRIENRISQSFAYKLAKNTYDGFLFWRRTMNILRDLRDTYIKIGDAWDGLLYTVQGVADYYSGLDLRTIRLTNISDLFPRSAFIELDYRVFSMQKSFADFNDAVHAMAIETDSLTGGNYGPLNPAIRATYAALQSSVLQSGQNTTNLLDNTNNELQELKSKSKGTSSDQQYLSNITRSTSNIISNQRIKVMNNGARNIALALYLTESESKQWLAYTRYVKGVATDVPDRFEDAVKSTKSANWAALAWALRQPRVFDQPTSDYLLNLSEKENEK
ncbi:MAG: hypothetical protein JXB48_11090 [Candidatus Latescibacteria bacterium]|nr:hypothetical protein [Candidatus Latescibacterota bacterium]